eukprot:Nitzschia sp. Nitz4//scaffold1_size375055//255450//256143//NITZ4_000299-RA/size375055-augustus-gene-0.721-mRNA-1//-1//CDS//3329541114//5747//frame0
MRQYPLLLLSFVVSVQSFCLNVALTSRALGFGNTRLYGAVPEELMTEEDKYISGLREVWNEIRHYDREEADKKLSGEWLEAYNRFYAKMEEDDIRLKEIEDELVKEEEEAVKPPKKKSKAKKRHDKVDRDREYEEELRKYKESHKSAKVRRAARMAQKAADEEERRRRRAISAAAAEAAAKARELVW